MVLVDLWFSCSQASQAFRASRGSHVFLVLCSRGHRGCPVFQGSRGPLLLWFFASLVLLVPVVGWLLSWFSWFL